MTETEIVMLPLRPECRYALAAAGRCGAVAIAQAGAEPPPGRTALEACFAPMPPDSSWGLAVPAATAGEWLAAEGVPARIPVVVICEEAAEPAAVAGAVGLARPRAGRVLVECHVPENGPAYLAAGAEGLVLKAGEAGGFNAELSSFVLAQMAPRFRAPVWIEGAWSPETAAAARAAGCGICLREELWLAREMAMPDTLRSLFMQADGTETSCLHDRSNRHYRTWIPRILPSAAALADTVSRGTELRVAVPGFQPLALASLYPFEVGQGMGLAASLARQGASLAGILEGFRGAAARLPALAARQRILAPGHGVAASLGTALPIVQGPMTRVSDCPEFARAVSEAGALSCLALGVLTPARIRELFARTREAVGGQPWAAGILGFLPPALYREQAGCVCEAQPRAVILAGGRPDQAAAFEGAGIKAFLHAPTPGLFRDHLAAGCRRFVFEGRECGGHVGPLFAFPLWRHVLDIVAALPDHTAADLEVLFAGGLHDRLSAAMLAVLAAPLAERGVKVGLLLGTPYLFTRECVKTGALTASFQATALACTRTRLLCTGPGHEMRCADTPFAHAFDESRQRLIEAGLGDGETRLRLEKLTLGRLRLAAKGVRRAAAEEGAEEPQRFLDDSAALVAAPPDIQRDQGLFMLGQAAILRDTPLTLAELHHGLCTESAGRLDAWAGRSPRPPPAARTRPPPAPIAIVGMSALFPQSPGTREYWQNIQRGFNAIRDVPAELFDASLYYDPDRKAPEHIYSRKGSFLDPVVFDPVEYRIPPVAVKAISTVQLLSLVVARRALEDAGYGSRPLERSRVSAVFTNSGQDNLGLGYGLRSSLPHLLSQTALGERAREQVLAAFRAVLPEWTEDSFPGFLPNLTAGRVANLLDLHGENLIIDAACASSLAALAHAVALLRAGASDAVLVGGVDRGMGPFAYTAFSRTQALSPRDVSCPFDESADGIVLAEGAAAVLLKRLDDAVRDGDRIYAVIRGVGFSSDGREASLTAPAKASIKLALQRAYDDAGLAPDTVELIEAHATSTSLGDRIELQALDEFVPATAGGPGRCAVGSVKSNLGHTKTVAGLAGLIKATLALSQQVLPPTVNVRTPNPRGLAAGSHFYINTALRPWIRRGDHPRRAGVSAFGFGGTNYHLVLEEFASPAQPPPPNLSAPPVELFAWQAPSRGELRERLETLNAALAAEALPSLERLAASCHLDESHRRRASGKAAAVRLALTAPDVATLRTRLAEVVARLDAGDPGGVEGCAWGEGALAAPPCVAVVFPGLGSQRIDMFRELALGNRDAVRLIETADATAATELPTALSAVLYPPAGFTPQEILQRIETLRSADCAQPALAVAEALAWQTLRGYGLRPAMAGGHSFGELSALHAAGVLAFDDLIRLCTRRGRVMQAAAAAIPGGMAAVMADRETVAAVLAEVGGGVGAANFNAPRQVVVSGPEAGLAAVCARFEAQGVRCVRLAVSGAFHSPAMRPAARQLADFQAGLAFGRPAIPVYSNVTAAPYEGSAGRMAHLLCRHITEPVAFAAMIERMHDDGARLFVELGPGNILSRLIDEILAGRPHRCLPLDTGDSDSRIGLARLLAALVAEGAEIELSPWFANRGLEPVPLATLLKDEEAARRPTPTRHVITPTDTVPWADFAARSEAGSRRPARAAAPAGLDSVLGDAVLPAAPVPQLPAIALPPELAPLPVAPAPAPAPTAPPPSVPVATPDAGATPPTATFRADLIEALSARTGYPKDMLDPSLPLESGLGIDSIKVMELFAQLKPYHPVLLGEGRPQEDLLVDFMQLKTLNDIVAYYDRRRALSPASPEATKPAGRDTPALSPSPAPPPATVQRQVLSAQPVRLDSDESLDAIIAGADGRGVLIVGDSPRLARFPGFEDGAAPVPVWRLSHGEAFRRVGERRLTADLLSRDSLTAAAEALRSDPAFSVGTLLNLLPLVFAPAGGEAPPARQATELTAALFNVAAVFEPELRRAGRPATLLTVTGLDGTFGLSRAADLRWPQAAAAGFTKSLAREWPEARAAIIDVAPDAPPGQTLIGLLAAARDAAGTETGVRTDRFVRPVLTETTPGNRGLDVRADSVVLAVGGAYGVTATMLAELATQAPATFILTGRTPLPDGPEPAATHGIEDEASLRQALIAEARAAGAAPPPAHVEPILRNLLRQRNIRHTIAALSAAGARVEYHAVDGRDAGRLAAFLDALYARFGRLDLVIHAAGILHDGPLTSRPPDALAEVIESKLIPAQVLAGSLRPETLRGLVFFSSAAARFGNAFQADYAAANECLNKLAEALAGRWPHVTVKAINWGPLAGGMVHAPLQALMRARGIEPLPLAAAAQALLRELRDRSGPVEVVIGATLDKLSQITGVPQDRAMME